jgi:predicted nicotinamide N-methyase
MLQYADADVELPYFGQIWGASRWLSSVVASLELKQKRILEIGCGLAMPSLLAAKHGAICTALDIHEDCEEFLIENIKRNHLTGRIKFIQTDWREFDVSGVEFDLVIASDVLYAKGQAESLEQLLSRVLTERNSAIIVDPSREYVEHFSDLLKSRQYQLERRNQFIKSVKYVDMRVRKAN